MKVMGRRLTQKYKIKVTGCKEKLIPPFWSVLNDNSFYAFLEDNSKRKSYIIIKVAFHEQVPHFLRTLIFKPYIFDRLRDKSSFRSAKMNMSKKCAKLKIFILVRLYDDLLHSLLKVYIEFSLLKV